MTVEAVDAAGLAALEPNLTRDVAGGAWYPQDAQVQPMLATAALLRRAREAGATIHLGTAVTGIDRDAARRGHGRADRRRRRAGDRARRS